MNQPFWATDAQSKTRMFGYLEQARSRVVFQRCMFASAYGPLLTRVFTFTHSTGCLPITDIIRAIRVISPTAEPAATSAVSLVPRASTQHPR
jgi:hypothetical protein